MPSVLAAALTLLAAFVVRFVFHALVVYAHAARRPASRIRMPGTGTDVHARHIDLEQTWPEIQQQLDSLADTVRRLAA